MSRKIPMLQALNCFEAAARHQSYTHAARELSLTQSAVSRQIASLESFLGVQLFQRTRHGVLLTSAGTSYARQIAARLDGLERDTLDTMARQGGGALQLASVPTFATRWLMPRLASLAVQQPEIVVHIDAYTKPFMFADTEYDGALYAGTPEQLARWPGTRATLLMQEEIVPIASPRLLQARSSWQPQDLLELTLLQPSTRPGAWRQWFDAMQVEGEARYGARYELFSMLAMAAVQGQGVVLLPRMLVEAELARGELQIVCERPLRGQRAYYLITPEAAHEKLAMQQFRAWLQASGGLIDLGGVEMRVVDQPDLVAERVQQLYRADAVAHIRQAVVHGGAQRDQAVDFLLDAVHAPVGDAALGAGLAVRQQAQLEAADSETDIKRLVEIRRRC